MAVLTDYCYETLCNIELHSFTVWLNYTSVYNSTRSPIGTKVNSCCRWPPPCWIAMECHHCQLKVVPSCQSSRLLLLLKGWRLVSSNLGRRATGKPAWLRSKDTQPSSWLASLDWRTREEPRERSIPCACFGFQINSGFSQWVYLASLMTLCASFTGPPSSNGARFAWNKSCRPWPRSMQIGLTATGIIDVFSL